MSCYKPAQMYELVNRATGQVFFRFKPSVRMEVVREFKIPCGQCCGCRTKTSREWGLRCLHESYSHIDNCFLTLTVSDDFLESVFPGGSLTYEPFQKFIRSFRKALGKPVRFFMCGEYGEKFSRPHYHAIIFGWFPPVGDRALIRQTEVGDHFTSNLVSRVWKFGFHDIGNFDINCALYVAGYVQKKINGRMAADWYKGKSPEFAQMSLKPGIGESFYKSNTSDIFRRDRITLRGGQELPVPRYYSYLHSLYHPSHMQKVKLKRMEPDPVRDAESTPERLAARKHIHLQRLRLKKRSFET